MSGYPSREEARLVLVPITSKAEGEIDCSYAYLIHRALITSKGDECILWSHSYLCCTRILRYQVKANGVSAQV